MTTIKNLERKLEALQKCRESDEKLYEAVENEIELLREIRDESKFQRIVETTFAMMVFGYLVGRAIRFCK